MLTTVDRKQQPQSSVYLPILFDQHSLTYVFRPFSPSLSCILCRIQVKKNLFSLQKCRVGTRNFICSLFEWVSEIMLSTRFLLNFWTADTHFQLSFVGFSTPKAILWPFCFVFPPCGLQFPTLCIPEHVEPSFLAQRWTKTSSNSLKHLHERFSGLGGSRFWN